jgi:hypothetical protein
MPSSAIGTVADAMNLTDEQMDRYSRHLILKSSCCKQECWWWEQAALVRLFPSILLLPG